ncbi:MAG: hypothetical protein M0Z43_09750 [Acidithiobacillus sp.]|nr:hypothetical protein [Acidithiobacillus sp.]
MSDQADIMNDLKTDGQAMTLTRTTPGVFDPVTGSPGTPVVRAWTVYGLMTNFSTLARYGGANMQPRTMVLAGDKQAKISALAVDSTGASVALEPLPSDVLHASGYDWVIIALDSVSPAGVDLMYNCHVRK